MRQMPISNRCAQHQVIGANSSTGCRVLPELLFRRDGMPDLTSSSALPEILLDAPARNRGEDHDAEETSLLVRDCIGAVGPDGLTNQPFHVSPDVLRRNSARSKASSSVADRVMEHRLPADGFARLQSIRQRAEDVGHGRSPATTPRAYETSRRRLIADRGIG